MKVLKFFLILLMPISLFAQSDFDVQNYFQFLFSNKNMQYADLANRFAPVNPYYSENSETIDFNQFTFYDSVLIKYGLTTAETDKLKKQRFMVTERLNYDSFGEAFFDIYKNDLPVFITTDAILHALHMSYDALLMDLEVSILRPKLMFVMDGLYQKYSELADRYQNNIQLQNALKDVDLFVTIAKSLLDEQKQNSQFSNQTKIDEVWGAIKAEKYAEIPIFSERNRRLDFSQFTVRGHYTQTIWDGQQETTLGNYFQAMIWLGRMDFLLTPPPENPFELPWGREEIRRMNLGAVLLNELLEISGTKLELSQIDNMITFMVGASDNLTPEGLYTILYDNNIQSAADLLNDTIYDSYLSALTGAPENGQRILSDIFLVDPFSAESAELPVSFRLMGQRFIVDSYIFSNVVFDRIIYQNKKVWRPLPDPLDAMFVLGNDDALPLLQEELESYNYSSQLASLRFLIDSYDQEFWDQSLYNVWLNTIRSVNPQKNQENLPFFMKTAPWHQQKLNTQLASWAQLRHDNLLYAKQSYTGGAGCSFPHSLIEPYPEFYAQIAGFAERALAYFSQFPFSNNPNEPLGRISLYFPKLKDIMNQLSSLAQKELDLIPFSIEEQDFLKNMLFQDGMSGAPPFSGWFPDLFYYIDDAAKIDYVVADAHTQPTDRNGNMVGRVLHVGVGKVNLGFFLAPSPSDNYQSMAYVGPVMSYYETVTENFDRLTDEKWTETVNAGLVPNRPDWVNSYLLDSRGGARIAGRELPGILYSDINQGNDLQPDEFYIYQNYPNPFSPAGGSSSGGMLETEIRFRIEKPNKVKISVYNLMGQKIITLLDRFKTTGLYKVYWNGRNETGQIVPSGVYLYQIKTDRKTTSRKMTIIW